MEGILTEVCQHHPGRGDVLGHRRANAAAAGTQIQHPAAVAGQRGHLNGAGGDEFRVCAGNQHGAVHIQIQIIEGPLADDIGRRLALHAPLKQLRKALLHILAHIEAQIPQQGLAVFPGRIGQQFPGFQFRRLHADMAQDMASVQQKVVIGLWHSLMPTSFSLNLSKPGFTRCLCPSVQE